MLFSFAERAAALEAEGVYIGSWSGKNIWKPRKDINGEYGKSTDLNWVPYVLLKTCRYVRGSH